MKAVILAAGYNRRLQGIIDVPKTLLKIGETTILEKQIQALKNAGLKKEEIYVISGYKRELIEAVHDKIIYNEKFMEFDNAYSVYLALNFITDKMNKDESVLIFDGDLVYDDQLIKQIMNSNKKDIIVTKKIDFSSKLKDETMIIDENKKIIKMTIPTKGINLEGIWQEKQLYTYIGILGISKNNAIKLKNDLSTSEMQKGWYTIPLVDIVNNGEFYSVEIPDGLKFCFDIDNPEDCERLKSINEEAK